MRLLIHARIDEVIADWRKRRQELLEEYDEYDDTDKDATVIKHALLIRAAELFDRARELEAINREVETGK
jgi:hypothetical protein